jgi:hypothetical protein
VDLGFLEHCNWLQFKQRLGQGCEKASRREADELGSDQVFWRTGGMFEADYSLTADSRCMTDDNFDCISQI